MKRIDDELYYFRTPKKNPSTGKHDMGQMVAREWTSHWWHLPLVRVEIGGRHFLMTADAPQLEWEERNAER